MHKYEEKMNVNIIRPKEIMTCFSDTAHVFPEAPASTFFIGDTRRKEIKLSYPTVKTACFYLVWWLSNPYLKLEFLNQ